MCLQSEFQTIYGLLLVEATSAVAQLHLTLLDQFC